MGSISRSEMIFKGFEECNILQSGIYKTYFNTNDPKGAARNSWARAFSRDHEFKEVMQCTWCNKTKSSKKFGHRYDGLCMSCGNKKDALLRKAAKFILSMPKNQRQSGLSAPLRVLISILKSLDDFQKMWRNQLSDYLIKNNLHLYQVYEDSCLISRFNGFFEKTKWLHSNSAIHLDKKEKTKPYPLSSLKFFLRKKELKIFEDYGRV